MSLEHESSSETSPVRFLERDAGRIVEPGIGLCLSGGGYRAMLFHLGAVWRLADCALLRRVDRVSSVSGGSITAALLGLRWRSLVFDEANIFKSFDSQIVEPIRALARQTIDVPAIIFGLALPGSVARRIDHAYRRCIFGDATLQELPDEPRFIINATNVQSGVLFAV